MSTNLMKYLLVALSMVAPMSSAFADRGTHQPTQPTHPGDSPSSHSGCDPTFGCPNIPGGGRGCDPTFGCPTGVPGGSAGCDPTFGCPNIPGGGRGCDPTFGCPTGVPGGGRGCDPTFGCPTGQGGPGTSRGRSTGDVYVPMPDGSIYDSATGEVFSPMYSGNQVIYYQGSAGSTFTHLNEGGYEGSNGDYIPAGTLAIPASGGRSGPSTAHLAVGAAVRSQGNVALYANGSQVVGELDPAEIYTVVEISGAWVAVRDQSGHLSAGWAQGAELVVVTAH